MYHNATVYLLILCVDTQRVWESATAVSDQFIVVSGFLLLCLLSLNVALMANDVLVDTAVNSDCHPGAVGFRTRILPFLYPLTLIRVNESTNEPIRDCRGLCIRCESGMLS